MANKETNLIWLDLEMTGLDLPRDRIIEIATVVTDKDLNIIAVGPELVVWQADTLLDGMDDWNRKHHNESGLVARVRSSGVTELEAEDLTLAFLVQHVEPGCSPICGNSIWQDRRFLLTYMPRLESFFHYRHLDVSTLKLLTKNWAPDLLQQLNKQSSHRALDDVMQSIAELEFYRKHILKI